MNDIEEVIPWNAKYALPNQAGRAWKSVIKLPPLNMTTFSSNSASNPIKIVLPAQGYLDTSKTVLSFDLTIKRSPNHTTNPPILRNCRVQNGIQSIFKRVTEYYGSLPLEDDDYYNVRTRMLTEALGTCQDAGVDNSAVCDGIGGKQAKYDDSGNVVGIFNTRVHSIQAYGINTSIAGGGTGTPYTFTPHSATNVFSATSADTVSTIPRRYCVKLATGLFSQGKLIPLQWLASQLMLQLELAPFADCMCADRTYIGGGESYEVSNVNLIATILNFDGSYEAGFLAGLQNGGVPIKFTSWDHFSLSMTANAQIQQQIPERNRSLKAIFSVQLPPARITAAAAGTLGAPWDSHAMLQSSGGISDTECRGLGYLQRFQFRVGSKYYPLQPVECGDTVNSNGAAEAYAEFAKTLNILGDTRLSTSITPTRWSRFVGGNGRGAALNTPVSYAMDWVGAEYGATAGGNSAVIGEGQYGPSMFVMASSFETSDGSEISGINGEEQNDITVNAFWNITQAGVTELKSFIAYDAIMMIGANNLVELIK